MINKIHTAKDEPYKADPIASIIIVTYNHKDYITNCLNSVSDQNYPHEIILVDNCSTDGTSELVEKIFPSVKIIKNTNNSGYGAANNRAIENSRGKFLVILNPDTIVTDGWLENLLQPLEISNKTITTPKILLIDGKKINTCGNINHFTGLTFTRGFGENFDTYNQIKEISGISGACFAIRKKEYLQLGGFDENFFLYNEDSDLSWRAQLKGYKILFIPSSQMFHDYKLKVSPEKLYYLEKGRYLILRKYYGFKELLLFSPSLFFTELLTTSYSLKYGSKGLRWKYKAFFEGVTTKVEKVEGNKIKLLKKLERNIPTNQLSSTLFEKWGIYITNMIFSLNYWGIR